MIFPNSSANSTFNSTTIPQFFNPTPISLPFCYNGGQINYRDSSWLKLNVCELFLKNECPNRDNCSLAHPQNTVKIENNTVTVCYDYIKKKDCKHDNCKYYHPHDGLGSAILRRGDDSKKNGDSLNNILLNIGLRNQSQINRPNELLNISTPNLLSSQINANLISDSQLKNKLEVMRQLNIVNGSAWLPGLNVATAPTLANPQSINQPNASLQTLLAGVSAKSSVLNQLGVLASTSNSTVNTSLANSITDTKISGKRAAIEAFGPNSSSINLINASNNNNNYGCVSEIKKIKYEEAVNQIMEKSDNTIDSNVPIQYMLPQSINSNIPQMPQSAHLAIPTLGGTNINAYNLLQNTPVQTSSINPYAHLPLTLNNLMLQSLLTTNPALSTNNHNLETLLGLSVPKVYPLVGTYPQVNLTQLSLLNQLYCQQLYQNSLANQTQLLYPGSINIAELQQRSFEETSVAFINDKGTILETLPVCKDFLQGKCKRNQSCNYVHLLDTHVEVKDNKLTVCKNALKGQCHRPICKFYHIPSYQLQKLGFTT